jgi:hypothetical protein
MPILYRLVYVVLIVAFPAKRILQEPFDKGVSTAGSRRGLL